MRPGALCDLVGTVTNASVETWHSKSSSFTNVRIYAILKQIQVESG